MWYCGVRPGASCILNKPSLPKSYASAQQRKTFEMGGLIKDLIKDLIGEITLDYQVGQMQGQRTIRREATQRSRVDRGQSREGGGVDLDTLSASFENEGGGLERGLSAVILSLPDDATCLHHSSCWGDPSHKLGSTNFYCYFITVIFLLS